MFDWQELVEAAAARVVPADIPLPAVSVIGTDTRTVGHGDMFLALRGERFDGHDFAAAAVDQGAAALCVDEQMIDAIVTATGGTTPCLCVGDTLAAYQAIARLHRRGFADLTMVAITGSSGKTSTRTIVGAVLSRHFDGAVLTTTANTNNHVGVPQNLLRLTPEHRGAVLELGTSGHGEIRPLTALVEPDIAILTNVGPVHLEGLGSVDGVAREKAGVFSKLGDHGSAILPVDLRHHPQIAPSLPVDRVLTVGNAGSGADVEVTYCGGDLTSARVIVCRGGRNVEFSWALPGAHQAMNAGVAFAVAQVLGIEDDCVVEGLASCQLPGMRLRTVEHDGVTWINDAYNANPDSVKALLDLLASAPHGGGHLHIVLGDMLELGPDTAQYHATALAYACERLPGARILPFGPLMAQAVRSFDLDAFEDIEDLRQHLTTHVAAGDLIAVKGSRGMALERLIP
ncbi:MAG: UDP-N-acetylmuramoyl-tripeptide--D-alanyl-D-alanine ligase [Lentisphaeria bacterium]|jgi:UDP-N-acetylmuramoyl-tripeptide--D-alanyl-D-alanine ligase|nr:UDP-N-acetylmuramoyl-tripeptide--D-alanyl-D-alanine ligase [Lentisphaeria bacterium]MDP7742044.1 UDP-N-acetylmuramoyl-tripeptide--D-alanyl-D-alanine ligase [Lentisphaeria bacterium]